MIRRPTTVSRAFRRARRAETGAKSPNFFTRRASPGYTHQPAAVGAPLILRIRRPMSHPKPKIDVAIGIVTRDGRVLICQRHAHNSFGGCWEFPGGKREPGETVEQCLARELREELGLNITSAQALKPIEHDYPTARVRLHPYLCTAPGGDPRPLASQQLKWIEPIALRTHTFPPANDPLIEEVIRRLTAPDTGGAIRAEATGDAQ